VTVYVDSMQAKVGRMRMCHMIADTDEELHAMAAAIGVRRKWWQSPEKTSGSHYDVCLKMRAAAIKNGAVQITVKQCAAMNYRRRFSGQLGLPADAIEWRQQHRKENGHAGTPDTD
jgi:hypothetical protein